MPNPAPLITHSGGKPKRVQWQAALQRAIAQHASPDVLKDIACKVIEKALDGDMDAIKEIGNRLDGKAIQATELNVSGGADMFRGMSKAEIMAAIRERISQDAVVAQALGLQPAPVIEGESTVVHLVTPTKQP